MLSSSQNEVKWLQGIVAEKNNETAVLMKNVNKLQVIVEQQNREIAALKEDDRVQKRKKQIYKLRCLQKKIVELTNPSSSTAEREHWRNRAAEGRGPCVEHRSEPRHCSRSQN